MQPLRRHTAKKGPRKLEILHCLISLIRVKPPIKARSYESIHKSFERNNQHTEISYKREINEFKTEANDRPPEPRRLPRGFNLYTRYDDSTRSPRSVDKPESRRRAYGKGGQYIREEVHTEVCPFFLLHVG